MSTTATTIGERCQQRLHALAEGGAVGQAGDRVVVGEVLQPFALGEEVDRVVDLLGQAFEQSDFLFVEDL